MIHGHLKAIVIKPDGREIIHCDAHNTIQTGLLNWLAGLLESDSNKSMDNLFTVYGVESQDHYDGIIIYDDDHSEYCQMKCTGAAEFGYTPGWSEPTTKSSMLTGIYTGIAGIIYPASEIKMGFDYQLATGGFATEFAHASAWASLTLAADDVLVIQWTITLQDA